MCVEQAFCAQAVERLSRRDQVVPVDADAHVLLLALAVVCGGHAGAVRFTLGARLAVCAVTMQSCGKGQGELSKYQFITLEKTNKQTRLLQLPTMSTRGQADPTVCPTSQFSREHFVTSRQEFGISPERPDGPEIRSFTADEPKHAGWRQTCPPVGQTTRNPTREARLLPNPQMQHSAPFLSRLCHTDTDSGRGLS